MRRWFVQGSGVGAPTWLAHTELPLRPRLDQIPTTTQPRTELIAGSPTRLTVTKIQLPSHSELTRHPQQPRLPDVPQSRIQRTSLTNEESQMGIRRDTDGRFVRRRGVRRGRGHDDHFRS